MSTTMHPEAAENGPGRISAVAPSSPPDLDPCDPPGLALSRPDESVDCGIEHRHTDDSHRCLSHPLAGVHQPRGRGGPTDLARCGSCDSSGSNDASLSCNVSNGTLSVPSLSPPAEEEPKTDEPRTPANDPNAIQVHAELTMALTRENLSRLPFFSSLDSRAPGILGFEDVDGFREIATIHQRATPLIVVIGVGYVGEHLVNVFSSRFNVIGYDISPVRTELLSQKFENNNRVLITSNTAVLRHGTHFLIAVPTLLRPDKTVDCSFLKSALEIVASNARHGATVVIESSVAVGMTRQLLGPVAWNKGLYAGMSPERVDPGRTEPPAHSIPKIVSGLDDIIPGSLRAVRRVYDAVFDTVVAVSRPEVAEMTKLYENCQRMVCIAFANEMADACELHGINSFEVCQAAATKPFGYMPMTPSLGVGGHCIPVNPYYLLANNEFPLLQAATLKMNDRPAEIARRSVARLYKRLGWRLEYDSDGDMRSLMVTPPDSDYEASRFRRLGSDADSAYLEALQRLEDETPLNTDQADPDGITNGADDKIDGESLDASDESLEDAQPLEDPPPLPYLPRVLVVGIGFKAGQSHLVNSPGVALAKSLLDLRKVSVKWCDPLVTQLALTEVSRFDEAHWSKSGLEEEFDMIIVAFRQHGLDFNVLRTLHGVDVEMWCP